MQNAINTDAIFKPVPQKTASGDKIVSEISLESDPVQADANEFEGVFLEDIAAASSETLPDFETLYSGVIPENGTALPPPDFAATAVPVYLSREQVQPASAVPVSVPVYEVVPVFEAPDVTPTDNPAATEIPVSKASKAGVVPSAETGIKTPSANEAVVAPSEQSVSDRSAHPQEGPISNAARQSDGTNSGDEQVFSNRAQERPAAVPVQSPEGRQNAETATLRAGLVSNSEATHAEHRPASPVVNELPGQTSLSQNADPTPVNSGTTTMPAVEGQLVARSAPASASSADAVLRPDNPQMARNTGDKALNPSDLSEKQNSVSVPAQSKEGAAVPPATASSLRSMPESKRSGGQFLYGSSHYRSAEVQSVPTGRGRSGPLTPTLSQSAPAHAIQGEPAVASPQVLTIDAAVSVGDHVLPDVELPLAGTELPVSQRSTTLTAMSPILQQESAAQFARISQQLMDVAMRHSDGPVELMLSPEELGRVKMNFAVQDSGLTVTVAAERSETLALIRRHIDVLLQDFHDVGFSGVNLEFTGHDPAGNSSDFDQDGSEHSGSSVGSPSTAGAEEQSPVRINVMNGAGAGLDLRL